MRREEVIVEAWFGSDAGNKKASDDLHLQPCGSVMPQSARLARDSNSPPRLFLREEREYSQQMSVAGTRHGWSRFRAMRQGFYPLQ